MKRIHFFAESIIAVLLCMFIMCEADATYISSFGDELSYPASISEANIIEGSANTFLIANCKCKLDTRTVKIS